MNLTFIIQFIALICLFFAALNLFPPPQGRPVWGWLGMFLWLLSLMLGSFILHTTAGVR
jgi:hypothetical protein